MKEASPERRPPLLLKMDRPAAREARRGGKLELALVRVTKRGDVRLVAFVRRPAGPAAIAYSVEDPPGPRALDDLRPGRR